MLTSPLALISFFLDDYCVPIINFMIFITQLNVESNLDEMMSQNGHWVAIAIKKVNLSIPTKDKT